MRKVKFLIGTLAAGGAERVVSNLSIRLDESIKRDILMFGKNAKIDYPYDGKIVLLDAKKHEGSLHKLRIMFERIQSLKKIKKQDNTTISFLEYPNLINILTSKAGKSVVSVRNHMSTKHNKGIKSLVWNATIKYGYPKADLIISVSEEIKRDLIENYSIQEDKIKVIYNSYDINKIQQHSRKNIGEEFEDIFEKPVIITAGRLDEQKGHWHLIRAFSKVKQDIPDAKLVILGEGKLEPYLRKLAKELNIHNDVHFLGFQSNPFKFIARSQVFVMSSFFEGFPNALSEAMACGIPVISSDCKSGPREILAPLEFNEEKIDYDIHKERYGILLPVCDGVKYQADEQLAKEEEIMANKITELIADKDLTNYFSEQSLTRIKDFNIEKTIKEWENII